MAWLNYLSSLGILLLSIKTISSYYISIDAHTDECFFERLTSGTKLLVTYEVIEGGFLDIDMKVNEGFSSTKEFYCDRFLMIRLDHWT